MTKKILVLAVLTALSMPVFAVDKNSGKEIDKHNGPRQEMADKDPGMRAKMHEIKAEPNPHKVQMKMRKQKLEQLVKDYKAAKNGSKKQAAAKEEIRKILTEVRDEQIAFREKKIAEFEERLAKMKTRLADEKSPDTKEAWIEKTTQLVIEENGNLGTVLKKQDAGKSGIHPHEMHHAKKMKAGKWEKPNHPGFDGGPQEPPAHDMLPIPPAPPEAE